MKQIFKLFFASLYFVMICGCMSNAPSRTLEEIEVLKACKSGTNEQLVATLEKLSTAENRPAAFCLHWIQENGMSPLELAVNNNNAQVIKTLLANGERVYINENAKIVGVHTPLAMAVVNNNLEIAKMLVNAGASVDVVTGHRGFAGNTPLLAIAIKNNNPGLVELLLKAGANPNDSRLASFDKPLLLAVAQSNIEIVKALIKAGADVNMMDANGLDKAGVTPLMAAVKKNDAAIVAALLAGGAKIDMKNLVGNTALMVAAMESKPPVLEALLQVGGHVDDTNAQGQTPLMLAAFANNATSVDVLVKAGAAVNAKDPKGVTPLGYAVIPRTQLATMGILFLTGVEVQARVSDERKARQVASLFITSEAKSISIKYEGDEAIVTATVKSDIGNSMILLMNLQKIGAKIKINNNNVGVVTALLAAGAKANVEIAGMPILLLAAVDSNSEVVSRLLKAGADIHGKDKKTGMTPLMVAIQTNDWEVAKSLIDAGADIDTKDHQGKTALDYARSSKNQKAVDALTKAAR